MGSLNFQKNLALTGTEHLKIRPSKNQVVDVIGRQNVRKSEVVVCIDCQAGASGKGGTGWNINDHVM